MPPIEENQDSEPIYKCLRTYLDVKTDPISFPLGLCLSYNLIKKINP